MPEIKFTERRIFDLAPPSEGAYVRYWDTEVKGLCVKVSKTGKKTYLFKGRLEGIRQPIWHTGPTCSDYNLEAMRDDVREWKVQLRKGVNPFQSKDERGPTVWDLCLENLERKRTSRRGLSRLHERDIRQLLTYVEGSHLSSMPVAEVGIRDAQGFLESYRDKDRQHDKLRWWLLNCFELAIKNGYIPLNANPWHYIDKRYVLPDANELPRFTDEEIERLAHYLRLAETGEAKHRYSLTWVKFIWFLIRNGTRPEETQRIERDWMKAVSGQWFIAHPSTKTGRKLIYLSNAAVESLKGLPTQVGNPYLFQGRSGYLKNYATSFSLLRKEAGINKPPYGIRRWFAQTGRKVFSGEIKPVQQLCGWETEEMALRYAGDDEELLENVVMQNSEVCSAVAKRVDEVVGF